MSSKKPDEKRMIRETIEKEEVKLPLPFCNLLHLHADIFHGEIVFGYYKPGPGKKPEVLSRVALPLQTLVTLRDLINTILANMEKDGAIKFIKEPPKSIKGIAK